MPKKKRKYLPYGLTKEEKADPVLRKKLSRCIKKVEKKSCPKSAKKDGKYDYRKCLANPVAVCRASIKKTRKKKKGVRRIKLDLREGVRRAKKIKKARAAAKKTK